MSDELLAVAALVIGFPALLFVVLFLAADPRGWDERNDEAQR